MKVCAFSPASASGMVRARWTLAVALLALLSLQVVSADHWHGVNEAAHCDVCLHAHDLPMATALHSVPIADHKTPESAATKLDLPVPHYCASGNRDPPIA